jgi:transposase
LAEIGKPPSEVARDLGIRGDMLRKWRRQFATPPRVRAAGAVFRATEAHELGRGDPAAAAARWRSMDKLYMREHLDAELARARPIAPAVIGIDGLPIRKRHVCRIVVSDLERGQPSGSAGSTAPRRAWRCSTTSSVLRGTGHPARGDGHVKSLPKRDQSARPQAAILYDKFHVLRKLNEAMDKVRKAEDQRLTNRTDRAYIKGQKYVLLSHRRISRLRDGSASRRCWRRTSG